MLYEIYTYMQVSFLQDIEIPYGITTSWYIPPETSKYSNGYSLGLSVDIVMNCAVHKMFNSFKYQYFHVYWKSL